MRRAYNILVRNAEIRKPTDSLTNRREDIIKIDLKVVTNDCIFNDNRPACYLKARNFFEYLSDLF